MTDTSSTPRAAGGDRTTRRVLFFCGEQSPWGRAHLRPLLDDHRVTLAGVVLATERRWAQFREKLNGEPAAPLPGPLGRVRRYVGTRLGRREDHAAAVRRLLAPARIPLLFSDSVNTVRDRQRFRETGAELFFSAAYPQIFGRLLLGIPRRGAYNSHPSLLPRCRGAHPVFWAIASGEQRSGGTIHLMTSELDRGGIVAQQEVALHSTDYHSDLYARLVESVPGLLNRFVEHLQAPGARPVPQDDAQATYFTNDRRADHIIHWSSMDAARIQRLVRACDGKAFFLRGTEEILVHRAAETHPGQVEVAADSFAPGTVVWLDQGHPVVAARDGLLTLHHCTTLDGKDVTLEKGQVLSENRDAQP